MNFGQPDPSLAVKNYRALADNYDASCARIASIRDETIALLGLRVGDRVLDVACGTGLSFPQLRSAVGDTGQVTGIELSPEMCALARRRINAATWSNVSVTEGNVLTAPVTQQASAPFDAILFHYTQDVLRQPVAIGRLLSLCRPGARVAVAGFKSAPLWAAPVTAIALWRGRKYMTTYEGISAPWDHLASMLMDFQWQSRLLGTGYVGWGRVAALGGS